jgi:hypothetical protein
VPLLNQSKLEVKWNGAVVRASTLLTPLMAMMAHPGLNL